MPRPRQSERQRSSSRAIHSLLPSPLGRDPPAARSLRRLLPVLSGGGQDTGTAVLRAVPGPNLKDCQGSYDHASDD